MRVEVCANSLESALNAEKAGADRIELCSELAVGGITPSYGLMKAVADKISIPVRVLIRPRSGDFTYSDAEFDIMKRNINLCSEIGFEGVVSGVLHHNFELDKKRTEALVNTSNNLKFTFHRAFDWVQNPIETLEKLEQLGIDTLLTSGQQTKAVNGLGLLISLNEKAKKLTVMPGSGINVENAAIFKSKGFDVIHLSGTKFRTSLLKPPSISMNSSQFLDETKIAISDEQTLGAVLKSVK